MHCDVGSLLKLPMHIVLGLWNACRNVKEEEAAEQKKQEGKQSGSTSVPSMSSMMGQAKSMMPSTSNMRMPSGLPNMNIRH